VGPPCSIPEAGKIKFPTAQNTEEPSYRPFSAKFYNLSKMVKKKSKSKRQTLKQKYKIEKRVREHHRRLDKEGKRKKAKGIQVVQTKQKDPGIPNEWPFKEDLLKQIERAKLNLEERKEAQNELRKDIKRKSLELRRGIAQVGMETMLSAADLVSSAAERSAAFSAATGAVGHGASSSAAAEDDGLAASAASGDGQSSRRAYLRELRKVVEQVCQALPTKCPAYARTPLSFHCICLIVFRVSFLLRTLSLKLHLSRVNAHVDWSVEMRCLDAAR
jgi:hypothetical protein